MTPTTPTPEMVTAGEAAKRVDGITKHMVVRWWKMGLVRAKEHLMGANLYSLEDIVKLAAKPKDQLFAVQKQLNHGEVEIVRKQKSTKALKNCEVCGRDTRQRSGICNRCFAPRQSRNGDES